MLKDSESVPHCIIVAEMSLFKIFTHFRKLSPNPKNFNVKSRNFQETESKAFSKSTNIKSPGMFSCSACCSMSYTERILSPIKRPSTKPDCVWEMILSMTNLSLKVRALEAILYMTDSREIGLQFFKNCLGLSPLGRQVIKHCLNEMENFQSIYPSLIECMYEVF